MGGPLTLNIAEIYLQAHEQTATSTKLHTPKFGNDLLITFIPYRIKNLHQNITFTNGEPMFLDNLLKLNNEKISLVVYRKPTHTGQYLHTVLITKQVVRKMFFWTPGLGRQAPIE